MSCNGIGIKLFFCKNVHPKKKKKKEKLESLNKDKVMEVTEVINWDKEVTWKCSREARRK